MTEHDRSFDIILETCLEAVTHGEETVEQCLSRYPEHADALRAPLQIAAGLRGAGALVVPSRAFERTAVARLRQRIAAADQPAPRRRLRLPSFATAMVGLVTLMLALVGAGVARAADAAVPGSPLYGLDRSIEQTRLALTARPEARLSLQLAFAEERLLEASLLAEQGNLPLFEIALKNYIDAVGKTTTISAPELDALRADALAKYRVDLKQLSGTLPEDYKDLVDEAVQASVLGADPISGDESEVTATPQPTEEVATATEEVAEREEIVSTVNAPGRSEDTPGAEHAAASSGRWQDAPGQTGEFPGKKGSPPGQSEDGPAQNEENPGRSGDAPGQTGETPGQSDAPPPGKADDTPAAPPVKDKDKDND